MNAVWKLQAATVQDVCDTLERPLAYSTVMTTLRILETKRQALRRRKSGRAYVYEPLITRDQVSETLLRDLKEHLFQGSFKSLVLSLMGGESVSAKDLSELKAVLSQLESKPSSKGKP